MGLLPPINKICLEKHKTQMHDMNTMSSWYTYMSYIIPESMYK